MVKFHVLLTGSPGIGKTTLVKSITDILKRDGVSVHGFYTEEVRQQKQRIGFDVVTFDGKRSPLARSSGVAASAKPRVGKYAVDIDAFESCSLPTMKLVNDSHAGVVVVDEIGKMEVLSKAFCDAVRSVFELNHCVVLATIPVTKGVPIPIVAEVAARSDTKVYEVTRENRDRLVEEIASKLESSVSRCPFE